MDNCLEALKKWTVISVAKTADNTAFVFQTNRGDFGFRTAGDCCSSSWVEHMSGLDVLIGGVVVNVESIDMPQDFAPSVNHGEVFLDEVWSYGVKITTNKGVFLLEYRNSSNGYYGGYLERDDSAVDDKTMSVVLKDF